MSELLKRINEVHQRHALAGDYEKTLVLLRALKAGEITLEAVSMTDNGWNLVTPGQQQPLAVTIEESPD